MNEQNPVTNHNLYALFRAHFPDRADATFLDHPRHPLRYGELEKASGRYLAVLRKIGVRPGDRVIAQVDKSPEAVLLYFACLRAGAIFIPLNTAYTAGERRYFIADAEPRLLVLRPQDASEMAQTHDGPALLTLGAAGEGSLPRQAQAAQAHTDIAPVGTEDIAAILYTSGTTGRSKGAMLSHGNLAANARALCTVWDWRRDDVLLHALPIFHVHGLFVALHCALLGGSAVIFLDRFEAGDVRRHLPRARVFMGVPTYYVRLLDDPAFGARDCANMRLFISGSAPLLPETFAAFEARSGQRIVERYGMTEAGIIASNPGNDDKAGRVPGTVGFALPGVSARVAGETGAPKAPGEVGILEISGPNVFSGYWRMAQKTAEEFRADGFFITGDMAVMDEDGRISIVGRGRDLVISGGFNVYPREVEGHIDAIPGVRESAVIGAPHPDFGEAVVAVVVREDSPAGAALTAQSIGQALTGHLAKFKQPKKILFADSLPRNTMGKVQKNILRQQAAGLFEARS
jgi:malonyl-CoA/methylmalonyl-CoA synthetase